MSRYWQVHNPISYTVRNPISYTVRNPISYTVSVILYAMLSGFSLYGLYSEKLG